METYGQTEDQLGRNLSRPLSQQTLFPIIKLLKEMAGLELYVTDTLDRPDKKQGQGRLKLGQNDTLQAEFGQDAMAIPFYPNRFLLTPESVDRIIATVREQALAAAAVAMDDSDIGGVASYLAQCTAPAENPQTRLEALLQESLNKERHNKQAWSSGGVICYACRTETVQQILNLARSAGFTIKQCHSLRGDKRIQTSITGGVTLADILSRAFRKTNQSDIIVFLKNDPAGENQMGPYALVLELQSILIINKRRTQELRNL